jgi:hypothetical protein
MEKLGTQPTCQSCGAPITKSQRFCGNCGTLIGIQQPHEEYTDTLTQLSQSVLIAEDISNPGSRTGATAAGTVKGPASFNPLTPPLLVPESNKPGNVARSGITKDSVTRPPEPLPIAVPETPLPDPKHLSRRRMLAGGLGAAALLVLGGAGTALLLSNRSSSQVAGKSAANTLPILFTCSTEKSAWMQTAVNAFHKSGATVNGKNIQIELDLRGSVDAQQRILNGNIQPVIWSPASFLELNQLNSAWQQAHSGQDIIVSSGNLQPRELVFSPLVFAIWQERANVLLKRYGNIDWPSIHDSLKLTNWTAIGGQPEWGPVKFGHTRPDKSNSGLLTITLLAYAFYNEERGLTVKQIDDPQFLSYFNDIEGAVYGFGRSSGTFIQNVVIPLGPPEFDIVTTYENLVLTSEKQAINAQHQPLEMFYPSLNIVSDHPFAILQGSWVTPEQQMAARTFRDFLLSVPQQRLALTTGFRPANINVQITDNLPGNVFLQQSSTISIKPQIQPLAQVPTSAVINELIKQWKASYDGSATTLG